MSVENPDLSHSSLTVDFGRVFYVTLYYEQAIKWCGKFKRRGVGKMDLFLDTHLMKKVYFN